MKKVFVQVSLSDRGVASVSVNEGGVAFVHVHTSEGGVALLYISLGEGGVAFVSFSEDGVAFVLASLSDLRRGLCGSQSERKRCGLSACQSQ